MKEPISNDFFRHVYHKRYLSLMYEEKKGSDIDQLSHVVKHMLQSKYERLSPNYFRSSSYMQ